MWLVLYLACVLPVAALFRVVEMRNPTNFPDDPFYLWSLALGAGFGWPLTLLFLGVAWIVLRRNPGGIPRR
jgi:hypothetical protein